MKTTYASFNEFYPAYLMDHKDPMSRKIHFVGFGIYLLGNVLGLVLWSWWPVIACTVVGYLMSWFGHYYFERNKPTSFGKPYWSMRAGRKMFLEMLIGRLDMSKNWV
jgi:hypothetical protein